MNRFQERKLSMYDVTLQQLTEDTDAGIIAKMPEFNTFLTQFGEAITEIKKAGATQVVQKEGIAKDKELRREKAITTALSVSKGARAYAVVNGDETLAVTMAYTRNKLARLADNVFVMHLKDIRDFATEKLPELKNYHVDAQLLADLNMAINSFDAVIPLPRKGVVGRKGATQLLKLGYDKAEAQLSRMDVLVDMLSEMEPDFVRNYTNSRILVDAGSRAVALRGFITDSNGNPVEKATVAIKGSKRTAKSTKKGQFRFMHLPPGVYELIVRKNGYRDLPVTAAITGTIRTELHATLELLE